MSQQRKMWAFVRAWDKVKASPCEALRPITGSRWRCSYWNYCATTPACCRAFQQFVETGVELQRARGDMPTARRWARLSKDDKADTPKKRGTPK